MTLRIPPKTKADARETTEAVQAAEAAKQTATNKAAIDALTPASTAAEIVAALQTA